MKRLLLMLAALAAFLFPPIVQAQDLSYGADWKTMATWRPLWMRSTNQPTGAVVQNRNWAYGGFGQSVAGFTDSVTFRRGATTATVYDTSAAYPREQFPFQPTLGPPGISAALVDTVSAPWIVLRVGQDTLSAGFTGASGLDSVRVAIEYSYDGVDWFSCSGTPTYRFDTVYMTSGADGLQSPTIIGVEITPGEDRVTIPIKCRPGQAFAGTAYIVNQTSCAAGNFLRFIIGMDATGQFRAEYLSWKKD